MNKKLKNTPYFLSFFMLFIGMGICQEVTSFSVMPPNMIFELLALNRDIATAARPKYRSPTDLVGSPDKTMLYVAEQTAKQIAVVDLGTNSVTKRIKLPNEVTGIAVAPDGSKVYATCSSEIWPNGIVCEVDPVGGTVIRRIAVGHSARSPVLSPDGGSLYVCNMFDNDISVVDVAAWIETDRIPVIREPYSSGITPDGATLVIANSLPDQKSTDTLGIASSISLINTETGTITANIFMPVGSHSVFGMTISPDGKYAFITHLIGQFNIPSTLIEGGWIHTNNFAIIDIAGENLLNDIELDLSSSGAANPWGIACSDDGSWLCVAHSGSNEISMIDMPKIIEIAESSDELLAHDFKSLLNIRKRVHVEGRAPRALAVIGNKAYTGGYFGDNLEIFDISLTTTKPSGYINLGPPEVLTTVRKGEYAYFDGDLCLQQWQSCHSCHPFTRPDALNWILQGDNNTPKNAKSMLYSWWTPPTAWSGRRRNAYESIRAGIRGELFIEPDERIAVTIDTLFMNLKPVPSPKLVKGRLSPAAERGRAIYYSDKVNCAICHPGPLFTDNRLAYAGVSDPFDANQAWATPNLIEAWRTSPYGHIGSYDDIEEIILLDGHSNARQKLNESEIKDLVEYILSL